MYDCIYQHCSWSGVPAAHQVRMHYICVIILSNVLLVSRVSTLYYPMYTLRIIMQLDTVIFVEDSFCFNFHSISQNVLVFVFILLLIERAIRR